MFFPVSAWFAAFLVTVAVEGPIVWWFVRGQEASVLRAGAAVLLANLASHPAVWFIFTQLLLVGTATFTLTTEAWAAVVEHAWMQPVPARRARRCARPRATRTG
jgi:hypothetical protein